MGHPGAAAARIGGREPLLANQRQQHLARPDRRGDHLDKVVAQVDRVDVLEDLVDAVAVSQPVVQPARRVGGLLPPVTDEDPARRWCQRLSHEPDPATAAPGSGYGSMRPRGPGAGGKTA